MLKHTGVVYLYTEKRTKNDTATSGPVYNFLSLSKAYESLHISNYTNVFIKFFHQNSVIFVKSTVLPDVGFK